MGKDRFAPHTRRFADVPTGPSLYAAELSTGVVKVGCSSAAQGRLMALAAEARRFLGADLQRFHVVRRSTQVGGRRAEVRAIERMKVLGVPVPGRQEFFRGVTFEQAVQVLLEVCGSQDRIEGADPRGDDGVISHGSSICLAEPLNTTQQISEAL